jgi:hypothetical protein
VAAGLDGGPRTPDGERRLGGQPVSEFGSSGIEFVARNDAVRQPDAQRLCRIDDFTEQDQLTGATFTDDARKPEGGTHIRKQAEA